MSGQRKTIERAIADDLLDAIYEAEGWMKRDKAGFPTRSARCASLYRITCDARRNRYVATPLSKAKGESA